jgi:PA14 domain
MPLDRRQSGWCLFALCLAPAFCQSPASNQTGEGTVAHFGTTVVISSALRGDIYFIPPDSQKLPKFEKLKPVSTIYTSELNVPRHDFTMGFPGVSGRFEWFAIDYTGSFWIDKPGNYTWALLSDDGSKLYIDGHEIIDNDGQHGPKGVAGVCKLKAGAHRIRISYFQGPRFQAALILAVIPPGEEDFTLFNTEDYLSPQAAAEVNKSKSEDTQASSGVKPFRKPGEDFVMAPTIPTH